MNVHTLRAQFPILQEKVNGQGLIYFDNAATTQKPQQVLDALVHYYTHYNANIHRGAHHLAHLATEAYEAARHKIAQHLNAHSKEINFVRGTTEAINLIAATYGRHFLQAGDEVLVSEMEHHSNIVPWQMLCAEKKVVLKVIPITDTGNWQYDALEELLSPKTKIVSVAYVSNALGTVHPIQKIIAAAHRVGAIVVVDGAQALPHMAVDVQTLDCDFLAFSAHKIYGPTGIGVLYGKQNLLDAMPPYMGGGEMIKQVAFDGTTYNELPYKFEAGTPNIAGAIATGAAIDFINQTGIANIAAHEQLLLRYATEKLNAIDGLRIIGTAENKSAVISFLVDDIHPYDLGVLLDKQGIAIRTGHHCCQPLMARLQIEGTCRASFACYNTLEEIEVFVNALQRAVELLR